MSKQHSNVFESLSTIENERDRLREALAFIAREVQRVQEADPTASLTHRLDGIRMTLKQLESEGLIEMPDAAPIAGFDPSASGTYEVLEDIDSTAIILADLEDLARQQA